MLRRFVPLLVGSFLLALPALARVDDAEYERRRGVDDRFRISVGPLFTTFDSDIRLDSEELGDGTAINLEDDLNLDDDVDDILVSGHWRFKRKHRFDFGWIRFTRDSLVELEEEIQFGDTVFTIGSEVETELENDFILASYAYSFVNNGRVDFGISFGLNMFVFDIELTEVTTIGGGAEDFEDDEDVQSAEDIVAPIPMIGTFVEVTLVPKLFFEAQVQIFDIEYEDIEATVTTFQTGLDWYPFKHFGIGVAYLLNNIDVTDDDLFDVELEFDGPRVYLSAIF